VVHNYKFYHYNNQLFYSSQDNNSHLYNPHNLLITSQPKQLIKSFSFTLILGYKDNTFYNTIQHKVIHILFTYLQMTKDLFSRGIIVLAVDIKINVPRGTPPPLPKLIYTLPLILSSPLPPLKSPLPPTVSPLI